MKKQINKVATIQNILDWAEKNRIEITAVDRFNANMEKYNWEFVLIRTAKLCSVEIVYILKQKTT